MGEVEISVKVCPASAFAGEDLGRVTVRRACRGTDDFGLTLENKPNAAAENRTAKLVETPGRAASKTPAKPENQRQRNTGIFDGKR
jgi:hypothetical protein